MEKPEPFDHLWRLNQPQFLAHVEAWLQETGDSCVNALPYHFKVPIPVVVWKDDVRASATGEAP